MTSVERAMKEMAEKASVMAHYASGGVIQVSRCFRWVDADIGSSEVVNWNMHPDLYRIKPNKRRVYAIQFNPGDGLEFREVGEAPKFDRNPYWQGWLVEES